MRLREPALAEATADSVRTGSVGTTLLLSRLKAWYVGFPRIFKYVARQRLHPLSSIYFPYASSLLADRPSRTARVWFARASGCLPRPYGIKPTNPARVMMTPDLFQSHRDSRVSRGLWGHLKWLPTNPDIGLIPVDPITKSPLLPYSGDRDDRSSGRTEAPLT